MCRLAALQVSRLQPCSICVSDAMRTTPTRDMLGRAKLARALGQGVLQSNSCGVRDQYPRTGSLDVSAGYLGDVGHGVCRSARFDDPDVSTVTS